MRAGQHARTRASVSGSTIPSKGTTCGTRRRSAFLPGDGPRSSRRLACSRCLSSPDRSISITRLGYGRGELVEHVGFWYYIFGEGKLENYVRRLPITSRSSHGRTTRGSSMTVEVFYPGDHDPEGDALRDFARELLEALEPILPLERADYHIP